MSFAQLTASVSPEIRHKALLIHTPEIAVFYMMVHTRGINGDKVYCNQVVSGLAVTDQAALGSGSVRCVRIPSGADANEKG